MAVVLVADDEEMIRTIAAAILRLAGHDVITAANGVEAVALYRSSPGRIDVVLTDINMPVMDGRQVIKLVRQVKPDVKIVCMSGYTDEQVPPDVPFLAKPFTPNDLRRAVESLLVPA